MSVFKNKENGTWYVMTRYTNWKGERKQKCKRGFETKREAQEWERRFHQQNNADMNMTFAAFVEIYANDLKNQQIISTASRRGCNHHTKNQEKQPHNQNAKVPL